MREVGRLIDPGKREEMKLTCSRQPGIFGLCLVTVLVFTLFGCGSQAASEPDNFRGVKWGAEVSSVNGLSQIASEGDLVFYERGDDNLQLDEIRLDQVIYGFHKGRFYMAMVYFPAAGFNRMQELLKRQLGEPARPDNTPSKLIWDGQNVSVLLSLGGKADMGRVVYMYKPIQLEVEIKK